jgi:hypothetical protein
MLIQFWYGILVLFEYNLTLIDGGTAIVGLVILLGGPLHGVRRVYIGLHNLLVFVTRYLTTPGFIRLLFIDLDVVHFLIIIFLLNEGN